MSLVTVQVGQCGNQLAERLFATVNDEAGAALAARDGRGGSYARDVYERFFRDTDGDAVSFTKRDADAPSAAGAGAGAGADARPRTVAHTASQARRVARAVLVDMEPKVVSACVSAAKRRRGGWRYDDTRTVTKQSGSANNWAHGYNTHGPAVRDAVVDAVRHEVEACDALDGFLLTQSVAGGTGSGLGTYVAEAIHEHFGDGFLLNAVVWPYESGEVIVQHYNSMLTVSHLCEVSDGVLVLQNDVANRVCRQLLATKSPSLDDLNGVMAQQIATALLPCVEDSRYTDRVAACADGDLGADAVGTGFGGGGVEWPAGSAAPATGASPSDARRKRRSVPRGGGVAMPPLSRTLMHLCSHPGYRLLNCRLIPQMPARSKAFSTHSWEGLLKHLLQMQIEGAAMEEGMGWRTSLTSGAHADHRICRAVAAMAVLRGPAVSAEADASGFFDPRLYASWSPSPALVATHERSFNDYDKAAAVVSNDRSVVPLLERSLQRAQSMCHAGAYLHQYAAHGLHRDDFEEAFARVEQVVHAYRTM